jgi:hypothetical protein
MSEHPYSSLPDYCFWRRAIAGVATQDVDPVVSAKFKITRSDRIATAGSCFAQHIARHLAQSGFNYFVTETAHPIVAGMANDYNYGLFTARYGNIYTSRQLVQTIKRAYGLFVPQDDSWPAANGRVIDPYRPRIQPDGFASHEELTEDRRQHFAAIRRAVEEMDVFVFTLGLTEAWYFLADGAVYPLCPGVAGGVYDEAKHGFVNLDVFHVIADLEETIDLIRSKNVNARFLLTVSPVPLVATMEDRSVLASTTYSKSVLRVAAEEIAGRYDEVAYFPSYEVITGNYTRSRYFDEGLREVTEEGVAHVMRLFMKHYADESSSASPQPAPTADQRHQDAEQIKRELAQIVAVMCDEVSLDADPTKVTEIPTPGPVADQDERSLATAGSADDNRSGPHAAWDVLTGAVPPAAHPRPEPSPAAQRPKGFWSWLRRRF